ncbi:MAG: hypothetical protein HYZ93_01830 [Candidatus Omnitrophica bacterium]|nr:hypothetical protein [Candidatus Omnitrophota bacterium]
MLPPRVVAGCLLTALFLASCGPTYPKNRLPESVVELCRREYKIEVKAQLAQTTLGAMVVIPGLIDELMRQAAASPGAPSAPILVDGQYAQDRLQFQFLAHGSFTRVPQEPKEDERRSPEEKRSRAMTMLDQVSNALRRVALSTDAPLEFYTLIARDPGPTNLDVIFSGHLNDLKRVQYFDISLGELQRRSRFAVRQQPEVVARQMVAQFLKDLSTQPIGQVLGRYGAPSRDLGALFPKVLALAVELQEGGREWIGGEWHLRQVESNRVLVYVPLSGPRSGRALLFTVQILPDGRGTLFDVDRLEGGALPAKVAPFGPPAQWENSFYLEPLFLPQFLTEQITKRVLAEFQPLVEKNPKSKEPAVGKPATMEDVTRVLVETSAYVLSTYQFKGCESLTVIDVLKGTRWTISAKDLPLYRRRNPPPLRPTQ